MINLFCGYDSREAVGFHTFIASVLANASDPVCIRRVDGKGMPQGSNEFTFSRFLVPWAMGYEGMAIFADASDMVMPGDISELAALYDDQFAVQVVKHRYKTRHPVKYVGTDMQCPNLDYERKNWASLMLINCGHPSWRGLDARVLTEALSMRERRDILGMQWIAPESIGELPPRWNVLADEGQETIGACLLHFTAGIPAFRHYRTSPGADVWREYRRQLTGVEA